MPWRHHWDHVRPLGSGGQGSTRVVRRRSDGQLAALKMLNRPSDPERRRRMRREAVALETLEHSGVPRYIDCNTKHWKEDAPLYLVVEYIEGPTLAERISHDGPFQMEDAVILGDRLADIVAYCHERGIAHRDIKPDNIVLRDDKVGDVVLIDFGQTFNLTEADEVDRRTATEQQLGNRFLHLPEHQVYGSKRDLRSDLTACCGVFFYVLTGEWPVTLRDGDGNAPFERPRVAAVFDRLHAGVRQFLGRGFRSRLDDRWQSAADLRSALRALLATRATSSNLGDLVEVQAAATRARAEQAQRRHNREGIAEDAAEALAAFFEPTRRDLLRRVAELRDAGMEVRFRDSWNGNSTNLSIQELVRAVVRRPDWAAGVFYLESFADGLKPFQVYLECRFEPNPGDMFVPIRFVLYLRHDGHQGGRDQTYYYHRDGRLVLAPGGVVEPDDMSRSVLDWLRDPTNWSFPDL
jgi:serine/threonine protein kinase